MSVPLVPPSEPSPPLLPGSVDQYVNTDVPLCRPDATASEVRAMLLDRAYQSIADVAVCALGDGSPHRLLGLIPLETVLAAEGATMVRDLMDGDPPVVSPGVGQEKAAWKAAQDGESSLAVVDAGGGFRGLVPPARLLAVLLAEHDEDLARTSRPRPQRAMPWTSQSEPVCGTGSPGLVLGLIGSALAAGLVDVFEDVLASDVRLAFFIPGIVYMADAVGTQTEALVIRGLSVGVPVRQVFGRESVTGLLVGLFLAALTIPTVWAVLGSFQLGLMLGLSLVAACGVATVVAMSLPWLMDRLGRDPAFGSGPLATVVQDLLSLAIYFVIAVSILG